MSDIDLWPLFQDLRFAGSRAHAQHGPCFVAEGRILVEDLLAWGRAGKVRVVESEEMNRLRKAELKSGARLSVEWQNGQSAEAVVTAPKGAMANPLSQDDIREKFSGLTEHILGKSKTASLIEMVMNGSVSSPVAELCALLTPAR